MADIRVEAGDMLDVIPRLVAEGVVCDACVCDPPYHLAATTARFANVPRNERTVGKHQYGRLARGFMGQQWDGGDIAFRPETWATVATILRPGAFLVAFGGTRTHHRVWCAIEDAGFVIQDTIMWLFGSGFPKRRDMLKPAFEPICLAYKPGGKRTMQVDECRVAMSSDDAAKIANMGGFGKASYQRQPGNSLHLSIDPMPCQDASPHALGRWPANIITDGSDEVLAAFPNAPGQQAEISRTAPSARTKNVYGVMQRNGEASQDRRYTENGSTDFAALPGARRGDSGSAARFFYSSKAAAGDRFGSRHPTVKPVDLMRWLVALVTPPGGTVIDPFAGSGTTGAAALWAERDAILIEREAQYVADIERRLSAWRDGSLLAMANGDRISLPSEREPAPSLLDDLDGEK